jgi:hypothetical protein
MPLTASSDRRAGSPGMIGQGRGKFVRILAVPKYNYIKELLILRLHEERHR